MESINLSESAVAVLRLLAKGCRVGVNERTLVAYRELADAGIMEPLPGSEASFRFTQDGRARREEWLDAAEAHLRSLQRRLPDRIDLSGEARELLRRRLAGDDGVTEANRPAHRELVAAGIMMLMGSFTKGDECVFRFTEQGWERRFEFAEIDSTKADA